MATNTTPLSRRPSLCEEYDTMSEHDERLERHHTCSSNPTVEEMKACPCCQARLKTMARTGIKADLAGELLRGTLAKPGSPARLAGETARATLRDMNKIPDEPGFSITFE